MKKIIISGHKGKLGNSIINNLKQSQNSFLIYVLDRNLNLKNYYDDSEIIDQNKVYENSYIINCAGETNNKDSMLEANYFYPIKILKKIEDKNISRFIHISSVGSFGARRFTGEIDEKFKYLRSKNFYEYTKAKFDKYITSKSYKFSYSILFPSNIIFDEDIPFKNFIKILKICFPKIYGQDGWLNFIHSDGVIEIIKKLIKEDISYQKIIINSPETYRESAKIISNLYGINLRSIYIPKIVAEFVYLLFNFLSFLGLSRFKLISNRIYEMHNNVFFISMYDDINLTCKSYGINYIFKNSDFN